MLPNKFDCLLNESSSNHKAVNTQTGQTICHRFYSVSMNFNKSLISFFTFVMTFAIAMQITISTSRSPPYIYLLSFTPTLFIRSIVLPRFIGRIHCFSSKPHDLHLHSKQATWRRTSVRLTSALNIFFSRVLDSPSPATLLLTHSYFLQRTEASVLPSTHLLHSYHHYHSHHCQHSYQQPCSPPSSEHAA